MLGSLGSEEDATAGMRILGHYFLFTCRPELSLPQDYLNVSGHVSVNEC